MNGVVYRQHTRPSKVGLSLTFAGAFCGALAALINFSGGPWLGVAPPGALMLLLVALASAFWELRIEVSDAGVYAGWGGPFWRRISPAVIRSVEVAVFPTGKFKGWGWRRSRTGDIALSDFGLARALVIGLADGKSVVVTLKDPDAAAAAVNTAAATATPAQGRQISASTGK